MNKSTKIQVSQPSMPDLDEFIPYLEEIWKRRWLTNNGHFLQQFEEELGNHLEVPNISVVANGTIALMIALKALNIKGEVITTPYSFVATSHALHWSGIIPVFSDIQRGSCNIDPSKIEQAITEKTTAIMPVHVYGNPCRHDRISEIALKHGLKLIYDAAHAFNVKENGTSILNWGDLSILSFHATKVFNTFEGGALVSHSADMKRYIDDLRNFGFRDEVTIVEAGVNGKMNELQAAFGLLSLKHIDDSIRKRGEIAEAYRTALENIKGISLAPETRNVQYNYSYFPVFVDESSYPLTRDGLYELLKDHNIFGRRYFYPLISNLGMYRELPSSSHENLPVANEISRAVLCLPIHDEMETENVKRIVQLVINPNIN